LWLTFGSRCIWSGIQIELDNAKENSLKRRKLGSSDIEVSALALGCWALAGGAGWGDQDEDEAIATIHAALDQGINFLDTAEAYGNGQSEEIVGKALLGRRDQAVVATKISPTHTDPAVLRDYCEASLRRLQTDYIDHYIVHWPITTHPVDESLAVLQELEQEGKIRSIGVSNYGKELLSEVIETDVRIDANQLCYSLLSRAIEYDVLPLCRAHDISVTAYMPLMQGLLTGKFQTIEDVPPFRMRTRHFSGDREMSRHGEPGAEKETFAAIDVVRSIAQELGEPMANVALAWVIAQPGVASAIAGARRPDQIARNVAAGSLDLAPDVIARLDVATKTLKEKLGTNIDYWNSVENARTR
jgi:aryl-alcohol dehydrogenase-like predicted oxidoreductase